jgi:hypothetical protein
MMVSLTLRLEVCPTFCVTVNQFEEKQIPYKIEKINMRAYGAFVVTNSLQSVTANALTSKGTSRDGSRIRFRVAFCR